MLSCTIPPKYNWCDADGNALLTAAYFGVRRISDYLEGTFLITNWWQEGKQDVLESLCRCCILVLAFAWEGTVHCDHHNSWNPLAFVL